MNTIAFHNLYLLLLIIPAIPLYLYARLKIFNTVIAYPPLQYTKLPASRFLLTLIGPVIESLILALIIASASGPHTYTSRETVTDSGIDVALVLDISLSMLADDFKPTRLDVMKDLAGKFIHQLGKDRVAVYVFAGYCFTQTPFTTDIEIAEELIQGIDYTSIDHSESGGTAIGDALAIAADTLAKNRFEKRDQAIVLISDGESNYGLDPVTVASYVKEQGIKLYAIGVGSDSSVKVMYNGYHFITTYDDGSEGILYTSFKGEELKEVAAAAGGVYFWAKDEKLFADIFSYIAKLEKSPLEKKMSKSIVSYRPVLALSVAILFLVYFFVEGLFIRRPYR